MILVCKDFSFDNRKLSTQKLISVNFDDDTTLPSSITREMDFSEMNKYRLKQNDYGIKYSDVLTFDLHLMKDINIYPDQTDLEFSNSEYEQIVSWLTSPKNNKWMTITKENGETCKVNGYFSAVTPMDKWGICYGIYCTFTCDSPFSYVEKKLSKTITNVTNFLVNNESSEMYDYVYPSFKITPTKNEEIFIHNMSDSKILDSGMLETTENKDANMLALSSKIESYAALHNLTVEYMYDNDQYVQYICDKTAILFYMSDRYGMKNKYCAYYLESNGQYYICQSGFFYCKLLKSLPITMDCENLSFYDALDRPVLFDQIGIEDEDEIYWPRLIYGNNTMSMKGSFNIDINYIEQRKGGLI